MSRGAGRLERAILSKIWDTQDGTSTTEICRFVYPDVERIEKRHRVAVLEVLHRIVGMPPRPTEDRNWTIQPAKRRGYWRSGYIVDGSGRSTLRSSRGSTSYHEAGHALVHLYFGWRIEKVAVLTWDQQRKLEHKASRRNELPDYAIGFVASIEDHSWMYDFLQGKTNPTEDPIGAGQELICLLAGPIAQAHYKGNWPLLQRGLSQTYGQFLEDSDGSDARKIGWILSAWHDDPAEQAKIGLRAQNLAQALIRSAPGWRFIEMLAAKMETLKHGQMGHRYCANVFKNAFGCPPSDYRSWDHHWPPTLAQLRHGWIPPASKPPSNPGGAERLPPHPSLS